MDSDDDRRDDELAILHALYRYGVIAPLVERERFASGEKTRLVTELADETHYWPGHGPTRVTERTIWSWLRAYREGGMAHLSPKHRSDRGQSRAVDQAVLERAVALRHENPKRWTKTLLDILKREGSFDGRHIPHRATLDRQLRGRGASRRQLRVLGERATIKMAFPDFGDLWVGDYHHGPLVLAPGGKPVTAKIGAFIDHTTRYPVADRYYPAEDLASLRDCLLRAFLRFGRAKKVYVDRAKIYRSDQLRYSLDRVDIKLVHSRAYYSQGRGVIERWWQIVGQFEDEVRLRPELHTLHELNRLWEAYRELRYCREVHSELGRSPAEAIAEITPSPLDPQVLRELFLVRADRTVHRKDCCVAVEGRRFLCDRALRGQRVRVRYDPGDLSSVLIFVDKKRRQRAFPQPLNATPEPHAESASAPPRPSVDYLSLVREDYDRQLLEHARPLAYVQMDVEPTFDADAFVRVVSSLADLKDHPSIRQELATFFDTYGPLPEELARIGAEHAVRLHGRRRHPRVYLHAIRTLVLAHWKTPNSEDIDS